MRRGRLATRLAARLARWLLAKAMRLDRGGDAHPCAHVVEDPTIDVERDGVQRRRPIVLSQLDHKGAERGGELGGFIIERMLQPRVVLLEASLPRDLVFEAIALLLESFEVTRAQIQRRAAAADSVPVDLQVMPPLSLAQQVADARQVEQQPVQALELASLQHVEWQLLWRGWCERGVGRGRRSRHRLPPHATSLG